jgi:hypothetical protein
MSSGRAAETEHIAKTIPATGPKKVEEFFMRTASSEREKVGL